MRKLDHGARRGDAEPPRHVAGEELEILRSAIDTLPEGVVVASRGGRFTLFNAAARSILGLGPDDVAPADWSAAYGCYLPDRRTPFPPERLPLARALRGEPAPQETIFIRNEARPEGLWISVSGVPLKDRRGEIGGGVALFRDITESTAASQTIRRLSSVVEQTADCVLMTDTSGTIEYVNPAFESMTGYRREEVLGKNPSVLKSGEHPPEFYRKLWDTILSGRSFRAAVTNRRKDGTLYWAEQTITPLRDHTGRITHFVSLLKDMTDRRKVQEQELQMRLAQEVQRRFYQVEAKVPGFELTGTAFPAKETGGDYYDFIPMRDGCWGIAIGDVTGHGFGSALLMAELRAYVRLVAQREPDVTRVLTLVNEILVNDLDDAGMVTLTLVRLDPAARRFIYASAGHVPGYLLDASGAVARVLEATGVPLGLFSGSRYGSSEELPLEPGMMLALLTDGVTESMGPGDRQFGSERAVGILQASRHESGPEIMEALYLSSRAHAQGRPQHDDATMVICKAD